MSGEHNGPHLGPMDLRWARVLINLHLENFPVGVTSHRFGEDGHDPDWISPSRVRMERLHAMFGQPEVRREKTVRMLERLRASLNARAGVVGDRKYDFRGDGEDDPQGRRLSPAALFTDLCKQGYKLCDVILIARTEVVELPRDEHDVPRVVWHYFLRGVYRHRLAMEASALHDVRMAPERLNVLGPRFEAHILERDEYAFGQAHRNYGVSATGGRSLQGLSLFLREGGRDFVDDGSRRRLVRFMPGSLYLQERTRDHDVALCQPVVQSASGFMDTEWLEVAPKCGRAQRVRSRLVHRDTSRVPSRSQGLVHGRQGDDRGEPKPQVYSRGDFEKNPALADDLLRERGFEDD